ncbi:MAG: hypothetical protein ACJATT_004262, partial [Myxococcota bacterium]
QRDDGNYATQAQDFKGIDHAAHLGLGDAYSQHRESTSAPASLFDAVGALL